MIPANCVNRHQRAERGLTVERYFSGVDGADGSLRAAGFPPKCDGSFGRPKTGVGWGGGGDEGVPNCNLGKPRTDDIRQV